MSPSEKADEIIRAEWRKLGFYYDFGEEPGRWKFVGSHSGLLKFRDLLNDYADDPRNAEPLGEHEHYWPYGYLKVETWHKPEIVGSRHARISGTLKDLRRLARLVEERVNTSGVGEKFLQRST